MTDAPANSGQALRSGIDQSGLDPKHRPQDDLFKHVNQKWIDAHELPADRSMDGAMRALYDQSEERVRGIITDADKTSGRDLNSVAGKIGATYRSFMDTDRIEKLGIEPIKGELAEIAKVPDRSPLAALLGKLQRTGAGGTVGLYVDNDAIDPTQYRLYFTQGGIGLPDEAYYREDQYEDIRQKYVPHIAKMLRLGGVGTEFGLDAAELSNDPDAAYLAAAQRVYDVEKKLAAGHWDVVTDRDAEKTYNPMTWTALKDSAPEFDWSAWAKAGGMTDQQLENLVVREPSFLTEMAKAWQEIPLEDWKLWAAYGLISSRASLLNDELVQANFDFYGTVLSGTPQLRDRWKRGVALVEGVLGEAVGQEYVKRYFPPEHKAKMEELVANLEEAYRRSIEKLDWLGPETKQKALEKLSKFTAKIGYPDKWRDYSKLEVDPNDLVGNVRRANEFETDYELAKLGKPLDRDEWFMTPQTVNAYYNPGFNEVVFPAAMLQPPFFNADAEDAANYGGIGAVIGHEIGHGFDDQGSKYDGDGKLEDWWTEADRAEFEKRTKKLVKQFDAYRPEQLEPDGPFVNGELTVGENIGDLGGLAIAINAYRIALEKAAEAAGKPIAEGVDPIETSPVIDGLTGLERVFLNWGKAWEQKGRTEEIARRIATDPHSPNEFRCNGVVRNLPDFYAAFNVGPDDELWLDPQDRVSIW